MLHIGDQAVDLSHVDRIAVVGAGKAGAGMAAGLEEALGDALLTAKDVSGWINVPADCLRPLKRIHLHAARPAGVNEPTVEGLAGAEEMLRLVASLGPRDLCLCLISGGGSALLPAPIEGVSLADKLAVTRFLSAAGANIRELNTVRKQLSRIKGGGLARACRAGHMFSLIISDVPGDPLDVIASGPTVADTSTPTDALAVLEKYGAAHAGIPSAVFQELSRKANAAPVASPFACQVTNLIIGNNARAVDAAGVEAERLGNSHAMTSSSEPEGAAEDVGRAFGSHGPLDAEIGRSELPDQRRRASCDAGRPRDPRLGRPQSTACAGRTDRTGRERVARHRASFGRHRRRRWPDRRRRRDRRRTSSRTSPRGWTGRGRLFARNDAYHFFAATGGLIKTGPTHTNVCDLRVVLVARTDI